MNGRDEGRLAVRLTGRQLVLLGAVEALLGSGPFFVPAAHKRIAPLRTRLEEAADAVEDELRRVWAAVGVPLADPTIDLAVQARRRATRATIRLTRAHLRSLLLGMPALLIEFRDKWTDFCVLSAPFNVDYYGLRLRDLRALGRRLQAELDRPAHPSTRPPESGRARHNAKRARRG